MLDPTFTITPEQQLEINTKAQPVPYGYILLDFLLLVKQFVLEHRHNYNSPPDQFGSALKIKEFDLETILNQNVRTA